MRINLSPQNPTVVAEIYNVADVNVLVVPEDTSTITVEWTISSAEDIKKGTALWQFWALGSVTGEPVSAEFDRSVSHLRFTAITGSGAVEYLKLGGV
jgi:hypothetical protein